jgi:hypothetical protein
MSPDPNQRLPSHSDDNKLCGSQAPSRHGSICPCPRCSTASPASDSELLSLQSALNSAKLAVGDNDPFMFLSPLEKSVRERECASSNAQRHDGNTVATPLLAEEPLAIENLISSPSPPVTTKRWSSTGIRNRRSSSLRAIRAPSINMSYVDDPVAAKRATETIVANIRAYLSGRRHNGCPSRTEDDPAPRDSRDHLAGDRDQSPDDEEANSYLVSTSDIAGILDIVIAGLRCFHDQHIPTDCLSVLFPKNPNTRPSAVSDRIIPPASCLAGPATTITSVNPLFSPMRQRSVAGLARGCTTATIITRQSVTEVT